MIYLLPFVQGAILIINIVLSIIFKGDYKVMSYWISSYTIIASGFYFYMNVERWIRIVSIVEILVSIGWIIGVCFIG